jgi:bla regulator protein blaR1
MRAEDRHLPKRLRNRLLAITSLAAGLAPVAIALLTTPSLRAQAAADAQPITFEVASVKPDNSLGATRGAGFQPGGRFLARNMPLRALIAIAWGEPRPLANFQIVGGPDWIDADRFDVEAKREGTFPETQVEAGFSTIGELMLRALLVERFQLKVHRETQQLPIFALTTARADRRPGPQLRASSGEDCTNNAPAIADSTALPRCGLFQFVAGTPANLRHARGRFMTIDQLAKNLESLAGRAVLNRSALTGTFSFDLEFTPGSPGATSTDPTTDGTTLFTALQEQLGLKMESTRGAVDVIVIDRAEHPSPD